MRDAVKGQRREGREKYRNHVLVVFNKAMRAKSFESTLDVFYGESTERKRRLIFGGADAR